MESDSTARNQERALENSNKPRLTRRRMIQGLGGGVFSAVGLYGWATRIEPFWVDVNRQALSIPNLPTALRGKTLIQISDFHIGTTDLEYLSSVIQTVNDLEPDLLFITGDLIDHDFANCDVVLGRVLSKLNPGRLGTAGCLGNHDYGHRWNEPRVADRVASIAADCGVPILRGERLEIAGLSVFGIEDLWGPRFEATGVLQHAKSDQAGLCLCHNPDVCDFRVWGDFQGVVLAGHTHGGQCKPPFAPPPRLPVQNRRYVSGFYDVGPGRTLYINRGVGYGLRARFNCRPEISVFTLG